MFIMYHLTNSSGKRILSGEPAKRTKKAKDFDPKKGFCASYVDFMKDDAMDDTCMKAFQALNPALQPGSGIFSVQHHTLHKRQQIAPR